MGSTGSIAILLALSLVWGSTWMANDTLRAQAGPLHLGMLRCLLAALLLACALCARQIYRRVTRKGQAALSHIHVPAGRSRPLAGPISGGAPTTRDHSWIAVNLLLGCTMFALPNLLLVWSAGHLAAGWMPMLYAGLPLALMLATGQLRTPAILGVGAMIVVLNGSLPITAGRLPWVLPIAGAVLLQGWSLIYAQRTHTQRIDAQRRCPAASSLQGVMVQLLTAALLLWTATRLWPETAPGAIAAQPLTHWPASSLGALCLLAGLGTAVAYPLYYRLLQNFEPPQLAVTQWLQTLVAIGESALLIPLRPGWPLLAASAVLIGCAALLLQSDSSETESYIRLTS